MKRCPALFACLLVFGLLAACGGQPIQRKDGSSSLRGFSLKQLAKSDVDTVVEIHQHEVVAALKTLALKLYRRNPDEWRKSGFGSAEAATDALFEALPRWRVSSQRTRDWEASVIDALREDYVGNRVEALIGGLLAMHMAAYNHQTEFYLLSELDPQKFYNAARNAQVVVWRLATARNRNDEPLLLANGVDDKGVANLSFEREFGKLIGVQDTLAKIVEDKNNRAIRFGVVNVASMVLLPI